MKENELNEIWKPICNYENLYQISNYGRVKSLERIIIRNDNKPYHQKEHIMNKYLRKNGYWYVVLSKKGKTAKCKNIHKLVAETFLDWHDYKFTNKDLNKVFDKNDLEINHINGDKNDNNVNNLEWCTRSYNLQEAFRLGLNVSQSKEKYGKDNFKSKKVIQKDKCGNIIKIWDSIQEAQNILKINNISKCCNNKKYYKTAGGYIWRYFNG